MTICYFGNYQKDYPRNDVLIRGLKQNGCKVLECQTRNTGIKKYLSLYKQHQKIRDKYDVLIVAFAGHSLVWFAKLISKKPVIFDAFVSLYLTNIEDRKICSARSIKAIYYAWLDKFSCQLADKVLLDTNAQIDYFIEKYRLPKDKFEKIFVGANDKIYYPQKPSVKCQMSGVFIVHWHGYIVPFYSIQTIIQAANILKQYQDIEFRIITRFNSKYEEIKNLASKLNLDNIKFYPETPREKIAEYIRQSDICLGIFGINQKAEVVIPNKTIEAIACQKSVITARHKVLNELFAEHANIIFTNPKDPADLAEKILTLKNNSQLRNKIALNGYQLYLKHLTPKVIGRQLKNILANL